MHSTEKVGVTFDKLTKKLRPTTDCLIKYVEEGEKWKLIAQWQIA